MLQIIPDFLLLTGKIQTLPSNYPGILVHNLENGRQSRNVVQKWRALSGEEVYITNDEGIPLYTDRSFWGQPAGINLYIFTPII